MRFIINLKCLICYQMAKAGRGAVMAATVISNDSGAELVGSRSSQNTLDPVSWSNKPSLETHGRRNSAGRCIACWWVASTYRLSCNPSAVWRSPRTTAGPVRARRESSLSLCLLLGMSSPHTSPGVFNGPRWGRMKGIYHSGKAFMLCLCTWTISIESWKMYLGLHLIHPISQYTVFLLNQHFKKYE